MNVLSLFGAFAFQEDPPNTTSHDNSDPECCHRRLEGMCVILFVTTGSTVRSSAGEIGGTCVTAKL